MGADGFFMDAIDASVSKESNGEGGMVAFEAPLTPKTNRRAGSGSSRHGARHGRASVPGRGRLLLGVAGLLGAMLGSRWAHRRRVAAGSWHGEGGGCGSAVLGIGPGGCAGKGSKEARGRRESSRLGSGCKSEKWGRGKGSWRRRLGGTGRRARG
jgi:hypothetical protein